MLKAKTPVTGRAFWRRSLPVLLFILGFTPSAVAARAAPLTPWGAAPQHYPGQTIDTDAVESYLATASVQDHRPLSLAICLQGVAAAAAKKDEEAWRAWELAQRADPTYASTTLAPARFAFLRHPERALRLLMTYPATVVCSFSGQQTAAANLLILLTFPFLIGVTISAGLVFARHAPSWHHLYAEHFQVVMPRLLAKWVVWLTLALPLAWRLGGLLWAGLLLAAAFPLLGRGERRFAYLLGVLLILAPLTVELIAGAVVPASPTHPATALARAQHGGATSEARAEIRRLREDYPEEAVFLFTESMLARQAGDLPAARDALARAERLATLPQARFEAAWGILAYQEGNIEEAIRHLTRATEAAPNVFRIRYNLSKAYARASLFLKADREMRTAFKIDPGRTRIEDQRRLKASAADLIEERLGSSDCWRFLGRIDQQEGFQLPAALAYLFPGGNPRLVWFGVWLLPLVGLLSRRWYLRLHIHTCCQCGTTVCRRCLKRRDRRVFCSDCGLTAGRWASAQYTQILLTKLLGRHDRLRDRVLDVARFVVPGLGAILRGDLARAFWQITVVAGALLWLASGGLPVKPLPWSSLEDQLLPATGFGIAALLLVMIWMMRAELSGIRRRTSLKVFLGSARPGSGKRPKVA